MPFKEGDELKVLDGVYSGFKGVIISLAGEDVPKRIGAKVYHPKGKSMPDVIWFEPNEIQITEEE